MNKISMNQSLLKVLHTHNTKYSQGSLYREILFNKDKDALMYIKNHKPKSLVIDAYNISYIFDSLKNDDFFLYTFFKEIMMEEHNRSKNSLIHFLIRDYHLLNNDKLKILNILYNDGFRDEQAFMVSRNSSHQTSISTACQRNEFFMAKKLIDMGFPLEYKNNSNNAIFYLYEKALYERNEPNFNIPSDRKMLIDHLLPLVTLPNKKDTPLICVLKSYCKNKDFDLFIHELKRLSQNKSFTFNINDDNLNIFSVLILMSTKENIGQFDEVFPDTFVEIKNKGLFLSKIFSVDIKDIEYKIEYMKKKKVKLTLSDFENAFTYIHKSDLPNNKIISLLKKFNDEFKFISSDFIFVITKMLYSKARCIKLKSDIIDKEFLEFISMILKNKKINIVNSDGNTILHTICYNPDFKNFKECVEHLLKNGFNSIDIPNKKGQRAIDLVKTETTAYDVLDYYSEKNVLLRNISIKNNDHENTKKRRI